MTHPLSTGAPTALPVTTAPSAQPVHLPSSTALVGVPQRVDRSSIALPLAPASDATAKRPAGGSQEGPAIKPRRGSMHESGAKEWSSTPVSPRLRSMVTVARHGDTVAQPDQHGQGRPSSPILSEPAHIPVTALNVLMPGFQEASADAIVAVLEKRRSETAASSTSAADTGGVSGVADTSAALQLARNLIAACLLAQAEKAPDRQQMTALVVQAQKWAAGEIPLPGLNDAGSTAATRATLAGATAKGSPRQGEKQRGEPSPEKSRARHASAGLPRRRDAATAAAGTYGATRTSKRLSEKPRPRTASTTNEGLAKPVSPASSPRLPAAARPSSPGPGVERIAMQWAERTVQAAFEMAAKEWHEFLACMLPPSEIARQITDHAASVKALMGEDGFNYVMAIVASNYGEAGGKPFEQGAIWLRLCRESNKRDIAVLEGWAGMKKSFHFWGLPPESQRFLILIEKLTAFAISKQTAATQQE